AFGCLNFFNCKIRRLTNLLSHIMDGSKIKNYFEALIKHHRNSANHSRVRLDDSGHGNIRTVISRLLQALQNQDKLNRDWLLRQPNYAQSLVLTLQSVPDRAVQLCSANCIAELLGHANTARRAQVFVKHGATMALCQSMAQEWRESAPNEAMLMLLHQILTKLAPKDKRLPARLRQHQCLPITLSLLRQCALASPGSGRQAHVPLALLKSACLSSQRNAAAAGRSGAIQQLLKLTEQCGRRQLTLLKLALDTLICLTRLRSNAARALGNGGLGLALAQFEDWQRRDNRNRNVPIRRALLLLLKQLTAVRAGRRALMELGGAEALYQLCRGSLGNAELEPLTSAATLILRQCAPRTRLPVPTPMSPHNVNLRYQQSATAGSALPSYQADSHNSCDLVDNDDLDDDDDDDDDDEEFDDDDDLDDEDNANGDDNSHQAGADSFEPDDCDGRSLAELNAAYGHLISQEAASQASPGPVSLPCLSKQSSGLASSASYLLNSSNMMASLEQSLTKSMRLSATDTSLLSVAAKPLTSRSQQQQQQQQRVSPWLSTTSDSSGVSILTERYVRLSNRVKSVARFQMLGYPDLIGATSPPYREALTERKSVCTQALVLEDARRWIDPSDIIDRVVYDLDDLIARSRSAASNTNRLINEDELELQQQQPPQQLNSHLTFESRFESGNLRRAIQVRRREYDLLLNPDIGHRGHLQWFYFRLSNCEAGVPYRFNIINCEKPGSQFTCGMRPLLFSVKEAMLGRAYWLRAGKDVCYYRNQYWRPKTANSGPRMPYYTASFTLTFKHSGDICYLAYYIPYTYTRLLADLEEWQSSGSDGGDILFSKQCLGNSLGGNQIHLVTVTAEPVDSNRPVVLITGRVHPGESNASWTVRGLGNYLVSPAARQLRREFIFKLVPMLNPDGVINGNHRCSLSAEDLNRAWLRPTVARQPEIYHTKGLLGLLCLTGHRPALYIDCHGHSRRNNVFMFGCSPTQSWVQGVDRNNPGWLLGAGGSGPPAEDPGYRALPRLLAQSAPAFSWSNCCFAVEKAKEATARVVVWRQMRIQCAYTLEASYSCCDQGLYRGFHMGVRELEEMGAKLAECLIRWKAFRSIPPSSATVAATAAVSPSVSAASRSATFLVGSDTEDRDENFLLQDGNSDGNDGDDSSAGSDLGHRRLSQEFLNEPDNELY
ncbi:hypothetical protein BOX15_Mlig013964g4, partial [Macrostomum lignano]